MTAAYDDNNIFAKILRDEIPSVRVYEDEHCIAFMDVMPQSPGHTLVVPRAPSRNMLDADPAVLANIMPAIQKIGRAITKAFDADGLRFHQFNEEPAGQTVFHLHFHLVPIYENKPLARHADGRMEDIEVLKAHAEKLRAELG